MKNRPELRRQHPIGPVLCRVDRDPLTGEVSLRLIRDDSVVEISEGAEYLTAFFAVDPFQPPEAKT